MILIPKLIPQKIIETGRLPQLDAVENHVELGRLIVVKISRNLLGQ